jgi:hypothetical protein
MFPEIHRAPSLVDHGPFADLTKPVVIVVETLPRTGTVSTAPSRKRSGQRPTGDVLGWKS